MTWHIEVVYRGLRPTIWSWGYPTKSAADQAKARLNKNAGPDRTFKVKRSPS